MNILTIYDIDCHSDENLHFDVFVLIRLSAYKLKTLEGGEEINLEDFIELCLYFNIHFLCMTCFVNFYQASTSGPGPEIREFFCINKK